MILLLQTGQKCKHESLNNGGFFKIMPKCDTLHTNVHQLSLSMCFGVCVFLFIYFSCLSPTTFFGAGHPEVAAFGRGDQRHYFLGYTYTGTYVKLTEGILTVTNQPTSLQHLVFPV